MRVLYCRPRQVGWAPITVQARLLAECLGVPLEVVDGDGRPRRAVRAARRLPRFRRGDDVLVIAPLPLNLERLLEPSFRLRGAGRVSVWVIDSFREETIPAVARDARFVDEILVGDAELVDVWRRATGRPVGWIPVGTDALAASRRARTEADRPVDLTRIGRQPTAWQDDATSAQMAAEVGLTFAGGPPLREDHADNQAGLHAAMERSRLTLSFSNTASPAGYTHPTHEYVTARWLDALAHGARVAGIAPRCEAADRLLPDAGLLELGTTEPVRGLELVREAARAWTPDRSADLRLHALRVADWRWRFAEVVQHLGVEAPELERQLDDLRGEIARRDGLSGAAGGG